MPHPKGNIIRCTEGEEHFLRRLGGALIVQWDELSTELKELMVQQAANMVDRHPMVGADFQIKEFISSHKGGDSRADRT